MNAWTVQMLAASAALMAAVLALRGVAARTFGSRAAYALWALPALRIFMPSLPGWTGVAGLDWPWRAAHVASPTVDAGAPVSAAPAALGSAAPALHPAADGLAVVIGAWPAIVVGVWLAGAVAMFGWQMLCYRRFMRRALRSARIFGRRDGVEIMLTAAVSGPVATGVLHRRIFLPLDFMSRYAPAERRLALLHEVEHHRRGDILANLLALAVFAIHWWNPLAYRAYRAFRIDQELACDACVLVAATADDRYAYGHAVLKSAAGRMPPGVCALSRKAELKERLRSMARRGCGARRLRLGGVIAALTVGAGLVGTASGQTSAHQAGSEGDPPPAPATIRAEARARAWPQAAEAQVIQANALREAQRAQARGLRLAAEARREAARQVREGLDASRFDDPASAQKAASDGRRLAEQARAFAAEQRAAAVQETLAERDADRACCGDETVQALREARQEVRQARSEARREVRLAGLETQRALEDARREIDAGRREADRARAEARRDRDDDDR